MSPLSVKGTRVMRRKRGPFPRARLDAIVARPLRGSVKLEERLLESNRAIGMPQPRERNTSGRSGNPIFSYKVPSLNETGSAAGVATHQSPSPDVHPLRVARTLRVFRRFGRTPEVAPQQLAAKAAMLQLPDKDGEGR